MSTFEDESGPEGGGESLLAAELALGVLAGAERDEAERLFSADTAFRSEVGFWQRRLAALMDEVAPATPPAQVWQRILREVEQRDASPAQPPRPSLWRSLALWRGLAFGGMGLAAASLAGLALLVPRPTPDLSLVATLREETGTARFIVSGDPGRGAFLVVPAAAGALDGRVPELWLIPADGTPRSLGLLDPSRAHNVALPAALAPHARGGTKLAVSLEPAGGSATGGPTGPVVASGEFTNP